MVSFSCEVCNETLAKKRLNGHFQRCPNAYFTCIDCNTTFQGNDFEKHTSCITEDQKYQGKLYKPKKTEAKAPEPKKEAKEPKKEAKEPKKDTKEPKSSKKESKKKLETKEPIAVKGESLYKVVKQLKKTHKLDTKALLKKLEVSGTLELK